MNIEAKPDVDLDELLDAEVPCGGNVLPFVECNRSAQLRGEGHGCRPNYEHPSYFKCITCWQIWYRANMEALARDGHIVCIYCRRRFATVDAFSDYRPF